MSSRFPSVCFIAPNAYPLLVDNEDIQLIGGAELQVVIVARLLAARGRQVSMICLDFGQDEAIMIDGIRVIRAFRPTAGVPVLRFISPRLTRIWAAMKTAQADVYYQQTAGMLTGVMAAFCKMHGRKSVFASASNPDLFPNTPRIRYARDRWIYSYGLRNVDCIFVQNDEQMQLCRTNVKREGILIPNCYAVPRSDWRRKDSGYVLWVSTIRRLKRPEMFLELAAAHPQYEFRMIGGPASGELGLYDSIEKRARSIRNLSFRGFMPYARTEAEFDHAALLVNTSESEGMPNAFLQAWARGIPTISFVDAGARFDGEQVGVRVESKEEMARTIGKLLSNGSLREEEGRRGRQYVERSHSPEVVLPLYERAFEALVN